VFGFRVGSLVRPGTFHALGLGIVSSTSVLAALNRIQRYSSIVSTNGRLVLLQQDGLVGLETRPEGMTVVPTIHCVDALVVGLCRILVQCAGPSAVPEKVVFMRPRMAPDSTAARVRSLLLKAMPSGEFDREAIARALNQSSSTLQRRLRDEGSSYQELLNATRHEMALEYLRQGRHSLVDVAFLLGFTDQSNFTRAFRRWTGKTPREYLS
jgi:AraC-like DNA-binding protein